MIDLCKNIKNILFIPHVGQIKKKKRSCFLVIYLPHRKHSIKIEVGEIDLTFL